MVLFLTALKWYKRRYIQHFMRLFSQQKTRVVLNGQWLCWADVRAGVPQGSILGLLMFLIYVNDLSNGLKSECKLFADDTSLSFVFYDINNSAYDLNEDLEKINNWAFKWVMKFNPDPKEQAQEISFSRKKTAPLDPVVRFDKRPVKLREIQKHLGMMLDLSYA